MYLSKKGYTIVKDTLLPEEITKLRRECKVEPFQESKYVVSSQDDNIFNIYVETKTKIIIPKMYGIKQFGIPNEITKSFIGQPLNNNIIFTGTLFENQKEPVKLLLKACEEKLGGILSLGTGCGKCHGINTPILMYDGSIKMVQDVKEGDLLMGDDSNPRRVLSLARGTDLMYDIIPVKGEKYTVNQEHILCLKNTTVSPSIRERKTSQGLSYDVLWWTDNKKKSQYSDSFENAEKFLKDINHQSISEISVKDYLKQNKTFKHHFKGYKVPVEFPEKQLELDSYLLGYWLGDGTSRYSQITTQESYVIKYFKENLGQYKCYLQYKSKYDYMINGDGSKKSGSNLFATFLHKYNLIQNKHIPMVYKCNSRENRLKLLAGILDSDGSLQNNGFDLIQKSEKLLDDIIYLARSLGFSCYKLISQKGCWYKGEYKSNTYYRINIHGEGLEDIPVLCPRKKAKKRLQKKNSLNTGITVQEVGYGKYYGFEIDGNKRYLLGDFTVTHNTTSALYTISKLKRKTLVIVNKVSLMEQWVKEINKFLPDAKVATLQGKDYNEENLSSSDITVVMLHSLSMINYPDKLFYDYGITVIDEIHNIATKVFSRALFKTSSYYTIGLSATPKRKDRCEYVFKRFIGDIVYSSENKRGGKPPIIKLLKLKSNDYKERFSINRFTSERTIQFTSMITDLVNMKNRNELIINTAIETIKKDSTRKILILSDRRNHLKELQKILSEEKNVSITNGMFIGGMKTEDLDISRKQQIIFATYQAFGEGVSEKDLDTLFLVTPKKYSKTNDSGKLEQIIGRIFRKIHIEKPPMIVDFQDIFSVYRNQANQRKNYYKETFKDSLIQEINIDLDDLRNSDNSNTRYNDTPKIVENEYIEFL